MIQIISSEKNDAYEWLTEVIQFLEKEQLDINKMILMITCKDKDSNDDSDTEIINYFNCSNKDLIAASGLLNKEVLKEEIRLELIQEIFEEDEEN